MEKCPSEKGMDLMEPFTETHVEEQQLRRPEKRWVRPSEDLEDQKTEDLFCKVKSNLDKLTPQTFQTLTQQIIDLDIDTGERLEGIVDLIFEKAIGEAAFCRICANVCRCLIPKKVVVEKDGVKKEITFRKILLNKCQKEFEKERSGEKRIHEKLEELSTEGLSEEELQMKKNELQDVEAVLNQRTLGNIQFIGELFKLKMLTENIMHDCVVKLLKRNDEMAFECLCKLLFTIGKDLDHVKAKPRVDQYFAQINKIIAARITSARVRFMMQDIVDLRGNNWVPRKEVLPADETWTRVCKELRNEIVKPKKFQNIKQLGSWVRPSKAGKQRTEEEQKTEEEEQKTEELFCKVRSILDQLVPETFQTLTQQITDLDIDTVERLEGTVDLIFEKVIEEAAFCGACVYMCRCLIRKRVVVEKYGVKKEITFRKILLNKCQKEYEKQKSVEKRIQEKLEELSSQGLSEEELQIKKNDLQDEEAILKRRTLAVIQFFGELFKLAMLTENLMHECVVKLLKSNDEEAFECLCKLLVTIGKGFDHVKVKPIVDWYFAQINKIIAAGITSARVRSMMQDIVDLRGSNWVPRREANDPKTIDQIHKEAADQAKKTQMMIQMAKQDKKLRASIGGRDSRRPNAVPPADETWATVGRGPRNVLVNPKMFQNIKRPVDSESISRGPGRLGYRALAMGSSEGSAVLGTGAGPSAAAAAGAVPGTAADDARPSNRKNDKKKEHHKSSSESDKESEEEEADMARDMD